MNASEDKIIEALKRADPADETDTLGQVLMDMWRNQSFFLRVYPWLAIAGATIGAIFAAVQFFRSEHSMQWTLYATLFICMLMVITLIKLWFYLCWVRNSIMREIKRVELRLAMGTGQPLDSK